MRCGLSLLKTWRCESTIHLQLTVEVEAEVSLDVAELLGIEITDLAVFIPRLHEACRGPHVLNIALDLMFLHAGVGDDNARRASMACSEKGVTRAVPLRCGAI